MHPSRWMLIGVLSLSMLVTAGGMAPAASDDPYEKWNEYIEPASVQQLEFVRWSDPQENSFSVEVPANWAVQGGVAWNGSNVARQWVKVRNPSNTAIVFIGDPDMLPRLVPNQVYERAGYNSGSTIPPRPVPGRCCSPIWQQNNTLFSTPAPFAPIRGTPEASGFSGIAPT